MMNHEWGQFVWLIRLSSGGWIADGRHTHPSFLLVYCEENVQRKLQGPLLALFAVAACNWVDESIIVRSLLSFYAKWLSQSEKTDQSLKLYLVKYCFVIVCSSKFTSHLREELTWVLIVFSKLGVAGRCYSWFSIQLDSDHDKSGGEWTK